MSKCTFVDKNDVDHSCHQNLLILMCSDIFRKKLYQINYVSSVCFDALRPSKQFFCHVGMVSCFPGLNQC